MSGFSKIGCIDNRTRSPRQAAMGAMTSTQGPYGTVIESTIRMSRSNDRLRQRDSYSDDGCDGISIGVNGVQLWRNS